MALKIQYASDLHLEFPGNKTFLKQHPLQPAGDVLVLAGDIVPFSVMAKHMDFFNSLGDQFEFVYWIPGNHEYYNFDIAEKSGVLEEKIKNNVFLVNNTAVVHKNVRLLFSTLWTKISVGNQYFIERGMNDFHRIKHRGHRFTSEQYNKLHGDSLVFLNEELTMNDEKHIAVFTHHCPTFMNYPAQFKGGVLNEAFAVELFDMIEPSPVEYWGYGHHHTNTPAFDIGNTKLITNQLGYVHLHEHGQFQTDKYVEFS